MKRLTIPEVLESLENENSKGKIKILKENDSKALRDILAFNFREDVVFTLPGDRPSELKIEETPIGLSTNTLFQQSRKLKIFIKGCGYDHLPRVKREHLFIQILESVHSSEAELLLQLCVDRKLKTSLTIEEVNAAFSGLIPVKESPKEEKQPDPEPVVKETPKEKKVYKDLQEVYEEASKEEKPEEKKVYKDLQEVYEESGLNKNKKDSEENKPKKTKTKKKSSKKKSK